MLLHCLPAVKEADDAAGSGLRALTAACDALAAAALPSGNLPSSLGSLEDRCARLRGCEGKCDYGALVRPSSGGPALSLPTADECTHL